MPYHIGQFGPFGDINSINAIVVLTARGGKSTYMEHPATMMTMCAAALLTCLHCLVFHRRLAEQWSSAAQQLYEKRPFLARVVYPSPYQKSPTYWAWLIIVSAIGGMLVGVTIFAGGLSRLHAG